MRVQARAPERALALGRVVRQATAGQVPLARPRPSGDPSVSHVAPLLRSSWCVLICDGCLSGVRACVRVCVCACVRVCLCAALPLAWCRAGEHDWLSRDAMNHKLELCNLPNCSPTRHVPPLA